MRVAQPVRKTRQQKRAEARLAMSDGLNHLTREQMFEEPLHRIRRVVMSPAALPGKNIERLPVRPRQPLEREQRRALRAIPCVNDGTPQRIRKQPTRALRARLLSWNGHR